MPIKGPRYTGKKKKPEWTPPKLEMNPNRGMPMPTPMPEPGMMESMRSFLDRFDTLMKAFKGGK